MLGWTMSYARCVVNSNFLLLSGWAGAESSVAMGILLAVFGGMLVVALVLGWMHARKERKRNEMVALSGFADDD